MTSALLIQPVPTGDAVARYERLSHGGSTWYDLMPTPANGTDSGWPAPPGPPLWPTFDGDQVIVVGQPTKLGLTGNMSFVAWASQPDGGDGYETLMTRDAGGANRFILSQNDTTGKAFVMLNIVANISVVSVTSVNDSAWHMIAATHDGATLKLYVDGELDASLAAVGSADIDTATDLDFGADTVPPDDYLEGRLDTCRIYNRALSADEILRDYYAGKPAHP